MSLKTYVNQTGRFGNQFIKNIAMSLLAEKHNLDIDYFDEHKFPSLGIKLFHGKNIHDKKVVIYENDYEKYYNQNNIDCNFDLSEVYLQTKFACNLIYDYLRKDQIKFEVINKNKFNFRFNNNNDCFIHIRLTDASQFNPGLDYYLKVLQSIKFDNLYIATDEPTHPIIKNIFQKYPNSNLFLQTINDTLHFGSTCKNIILSHGSFSAMIGYLAYYSNVYYPVYQEGKIWYGDMFSIEGWNKII